MTGSPAPDDVSDYTVDPTDPISVRVVDRVSAALGRDPFDLPPLYEAIEPDALDELAEVAGEGYHLTFPFAGVQVHVFETGEIRIDDVEAK